MKRILPLILILIAVILAGCGSASVSDVTPTPTPDPAILSATQPIGENIINSIANDDYDAFIRDMDETMIGSFDETTFEDLRSQLDSSLGSYQSNEFQTTLLEDGYYIAYFTLHFANGDAAMRVVITTTEPYKVSGLWFQ
ncbi:MAG TPA: DUF3887 domain-containing protein [Longilinea sp.]|nr:DUF3887 domain-containing protein [Longilinea sp.]